MGKAFGLIEDIIGHLVLFMDQEGPCGKDEFYDLHIDGLFLLEVRVGNKIDYGLVQSLSKGMVGVLFRASVKGSTDLGGAQIVTYKQFKQSDVLGVSALVFAIQILGKPVSVFRGKGRHDMV
jgi:hypothetical protein